MRIYKELPQGWSSAKLSEVLTKISNGFTQRQSKDGRGLPVTRIETISKGTIDLERVGYLENLPADVVEKFRLLNGDVLFSHINSDLHLGKTAVFHMQPLTLLHGMNLLLLRPIPEVVKSEFLHYLFNHYRYSGLFIDIAQHAVNQSSINQAKLNNLEILVPPIAEQQKIIEEIEKQFTRLDAAVAALKRVQAQLKRYRASVLKAACEGNLVPTEAELARTEGRDFESADQLLGRILKERRARWEADQIAKMRAAGKEQKDDSWKDKYQAPAAPDISNLPQLPDGWVWSTAEQINIASRPCSYGVLQPGPDLENGIPIVRVGDIENGSIRTKALKRIAPEIAAAYPRTKLVGGEVLITLVGAIGRTAVVPKILAGANTARAVGVIPICGEVESAWVELWFRNPSKVNEMTAKSHEVARKTLNLEDVRIASIALPPLVEQQRIVAEVERRLSVIDEIESVVEANLKRAAALRQSILKRAFAGKLVPQDPQDEPANILLERIRAERASREAEAKAAKPSRKKKPSGAATPA